MPDLDRYLERIGYPGTPRPDLATLRTLHRRHVRAIAYENLDVRLGIPVSLDVEPIYDKLVLAGRGGWCYEMNGLLAWALEEAGFTLTRMAAGVLREFRGDAAVGNHLALLVELDEPYLADVGFGDGLLEPIPIRAGDHVQGGFRFRLEQLDDGWWRFHNHQHGAVASFDFETRPGDLERLRQQCAFLQTSPDSPFTQWTVVQRHVPGALVVLRERTISRVTPEGARRRVVEHAADFRHALSHTFGLRFEDSQRLWLATRAPEERDRRA